jgi:hypothetical protein
VRLQPGGRGVELGEGRDEDDRPIAAAGEQHAVGVDAQLGGIASVPQARSTPPELAAAARPPGSPRRRPARARPRRRRAAWVDVWRGLGGRSSSTIEPARRDARMRLGGSRRRERAVPWLSLDNHCRPADTHEEVTCQEGGIPMLTSRRRSGTRNVTAGVSSSWAHGRMAGARCTARTTTSRPRRR